MSHDIQIHKGTSCRISEYLKKTFCALSLKSFFSVLIGWVLREQFMGVICQMPDLSSHLHTIGRVRNPWPPFIRLHIFNNQGQWLGTEAKRSFLFLNKRPLRQIVHQRLISFGLFFFLAPHEGIFGGGQTFHLIKDTFHISSPLSPVISLCVHISYPRISLSPSMSFLFLTIHHMKPKGALYRYSSSWCLLKWWLTSLWCFFQIGTKQKNTFKSRFRQGQGCQINAAIQQSITFCLHTWVLHIINMPCDWVGFSGISSICFEKWRGGNGCSVWLCSNSGGGCSRITASGRVFII